MRQSICNSKNDNIPEVEDAVGAGVRVLDLHVEVGQRCPERNVLRD